MSYQTYTETPIEEWQDFVLWDEDYYNNPTVTRGNDRHGYLGVGTSGIESPYVTSAPPSNYDGPSSFDYVVSAPPSIIDESSSYGHFYGTSPTFSSTATSPLVGRDDGRYFGSFGACDYLLPPVREATESPLLDTTRERIVDSTGSLATTAGTFLNPHVAGSFQAFSRQDVVASQILASTGGWTDQGSISEPIAECGEDRASTSPIPIIRAQSQSLNSSFDSYEHRIYDQRTRAITIPQPGGGPTSHSARVPHPQWASKAPPMLSMSPVSQRRPRSATLSRSSSRAEQRKNRASPSPTSAHSLGWISMQMNNQSGRMAATSSESTPGRVPKGRKKGLDPRQRSEAALMRIIGSCSNCKKRKEKCDPGTPCKSCLKHYKGDLVKNPCRNHLLANLSKAFLSDRHAWHPTARSLESCITPDAFNVSTDVTHKIELYFGFGQPIKVSVHPVEIDNPQPLVHKHLVYSWPPQSSTSSTHTQAVLPAVLTEETVAGLESALDAHLALLVMSEFQAFPLYCSPLRTLHRVYIFFRSLQPDSAPWRLLLDALKLLVLVHVGGDITLPKQFESPPLARLVRSTMNVSRDKQPSPCFIRAQFGAVMPTLASRLMERVLSSLELLLLSRNGDHWPLALATLLIVLMTVESIHYHAAKLPYHDAHDVDRALHSTDGLDADDSAVDTILAFYKACFSACHTRLRPDWEGELNTATGSSSPADQFVKSVREAVGKASAGDYLESKVREKRVDEEDMGFFFDRLVARLLLLES
ncbi:hypothetical protein EKO04_009376 [Ascochyta lentis]|uniref:Zn(2)-C6 fungal-type domain-containing protein n=1 Tax=Ascochyta lentis TaxID=205686 RepID=A0A8H7IWX6_9PLEO|nr:hypothetical protein EKO04_009376 [Ascochyta lentis]